MKSGAQYMDILSLHTVAWSRYKSIIERREKQEKAKSDTHRARAKMDCDTLMSNLSILHPELRLIDFDKQFGSKWAIIQNGKGRSIELNRIVIVEVRTEYYGTDNKDAPDQHREVLIFGDSENMERPWLRLLNEQKEKAEIWLVQPEFESLVSRGRLRIDKIRVLSVERKIRKDESPWFLIDEFKRRSY